MQLSIICVYNNKQILEKCLLNSLNNQNVDYELILIDNSFGEFTCAADALNFGGNKASGEFLLFVHQDVIFFEKNLEDILSYCNNCKNLGIAGVAGTDINEGNVKSNGVHNIPPEDMALIHINDIEPAQTLDEVLLIVPKEIFNKFKFDNVTCNHWHLYGADYCLQLIKNSFCVYILPIKLYHCSNGFSMSIEYYKTLKKILNKYINDFDCIHTTCLGTHYTKNQLKVNILYFLYKYHLTFLERIVGKSTFVLNILKKVIK